MSEINTDSLLRVVSHDRDTIYCRRSFVNMTDSINAAILLHQILYWWGVKRGEPFYKFRAPCTSDLYKDGDSWCEELCFKPKEFDTALDVIGTKITRGTNKSDYKNTKFPQPNDGESYAEYTKRFEATLKCCVFYWTDKNRVTWYEVNGDLLAHFIAASDENKLWGLRELRSRTFSGRAKELAALPRKSKQNESSNLDTDLIANLAITVIADSAISYRIAESAITYIPEITPETTTISLPSSNPLKSEDIKPNPAYQLFDDKNSKEVSDPLGLAAKKIDASAAQKNENDYTKPDEKHDDNALATAAALMYGSFKKIDDSESEILKKKLKSRNKVDVRDRDLSIKIAEAIKPKGNGAGVKLAKVLAEALDKGYYHIDDITSTMDEKLYKSSPLDLYDSNAEFVQFVEQALGFWAYASREQVVKTICNYSYIKGNEKGWLAYWKSVHTTDEGLPTYTAEQLKTMLDRGDIDKVVYDYWLERAND